MGLKLDRNRIIGRGSSRRCFQHPFEKSRCVKVEKRDYLKITREEIKYYKRFQKRGISWDMLAKFHGTVETDLGEGAVFDMPHDYNGEISRTLDYYLHVQSIPANELGRALRAFKDYMMQERIVVRELKADNLVYQRNSRSLGKIVLIDGVGNNEFLPIANYSNVFAKRTLSKKWGKFLRRLSQEYPFNPVVKEVIAGLRS